MADWKNVLYTRNAVLAGLIVVVLLVLYVVERDRERNSEEIAGNQSTSTPQFVTFSFDGSRSKDMWEETRNFSKEMESGGKKIKFTYFVSGVYFLTSENKNTYVSPYGKRGESRLEFAKDAEEIQTRISEINAAIGEGHEIASHGNGHFDGRAWTEAQWKQELESFKKLLFGIKENNPGILVSEDLKLMPEDVVGFRAPELAVNSSVYTPLRELGYRYDASAVAHTPEWPKKDARGIWQFPLHDIVLEPDARTTISIDYSMYYLQSGAKDVAKKGTPLWGRFHNEIVDAYMKHFTEQYENERAPISVVNHFTKWNDGVYFEAMKDFARNVCGLPDVRCTTYRELTDYLDRASVDATE